MQTPIVQMLKAYAASHSIRPHMPGHKGKAFLPEWDALYQLDITEIPGADSLFEADGVIAESERLAAALFGTAGTVYSCGGSTACIQAMLALMRQENRTIIAARNVHRSFLNACMLLGLQVYWVYPETADGILSGSYPPERFEAALRSVSGKACIYLTSPDYLGRIADIPAIAKLCHAYNARLLVDNAHGSHLAFEEPSRHPIANGADFCCDSAHKTLPCLTGCAYLHAAHAEDVPRLKPAMGIFASTSPSYLLLASLDACNPYLAAEVRSDMARLSIAVANAKKQLSGRYCFLGSDTLHFTIGAAAAGMDGISLAEELSAQGLAAEYADRDVVVLLLSTTTTPDELQQMTAALLACHPAAYPAGQKKPITLPQPKAILDIRTAALSAYRMVPVRESIGCICGMVQVPCPPAIPIVCSGEQITEEAADVLEHYGITEIAVLATSQAEPA